MTLGRVTGLRTGEDIEHLGMRPSVAHEAHLALDDMEADDWFVVADA